MTHNPYYAFAGGVTDYQCDKCGRRDPTAMKRGLSAAITQLKDSSGPIDPATLCETCCASYPTREWMSAAPR